MEVFTPMAEVQGGSVVPWDTEEKEAGGFYREELVEEPWLTMLLEVLAEVQELMGMEVVAALVVEVGTLVEVAEKTNGVHVEGEEDPTMLAKTNGINAATEQVVMVRLP